MLQKQVLLERTWGRLNNVICQAVFCLITTEYVDLQAVEKLLGNKIITSAVFGGWIVLGQKKKLLAFREILSFYDNDSPFIHDP